MRTKGGLSEEMNKDLAKGMTAASSILHRANDAIDKEHRLEAVSELQSRVEDWKGHKIDHFGELLLHGNFTVLKGEGAKEVEREVSNIFTSHPLPVYNMLLDSIPEEQPMIGAPAPPRERSDSCSSFAYLDMENLANALDTLKVENSEPPVAPTMLTPKGIKEQLDRVIVPCAPKSRILIAYSRDDFGLEPCSAPLAQGQRSGVKLDSVRHDTGTRLSFKYTGKDGKTGSLKDALPFNLSHEHAYNLPRLERFRTTC